MAFDGTGGARPTLLCVDDEPDFIELARLCFAPAGWDVVGAVNVAEAKALLATTAVDGVLSDVGMRGGSGLELLTWARQERGPSLAFFLLTGSVDYRTPDAITAGADGVFSKPCDWGLVVKSFTIKLTAKSSVSPN